MVKRVKAEVVDYSRRQYQERTEGKASFSNRLRQAWRRIKLGIAIILDITDFFIAWIPLVNEAWDIVSFIVLLGILKNRRIALLSLVELPLIGLPPFSIIDMFLPICTLCVLLDNQMEEMRRHDD